MHNPNRLKFNSANPLSPIIERVIVTSTYMILLVRFFSVGTGGQNHHALLARVLALLTQAKGTIYLVF